MSRHHAQLAVDDAGAVWLSSLGREPVSVNGKPATEAVELFTGDQIEVSISFRRRLSWHATFQVADSAQPLCSDMQTAG